MKAGDEVAVLRSAATDEKRARRPSGQGSDSMKVEVVKSHCGIQKGTVFYKPRKIAEMMIAKGFYRSAE